MKATHGDPGACISRAASAGRGEHGAVDLGHEAAVLGNPDEGLGRDQPHHRVAQARERLGTDDGAVARGDDGLEAGFDGVTGDRPHERALGLDAPDGTLVEARIEERRAVAPALLGGVQRGVRVSQQRLGAGIAVARDRNSRADGEAQLAPLDRERPAEHGAQLLDDLHRLGFVLHLVADDRELVAAHARDGVTGAQRAGQAAGDGDQHQVSLEVAERLVHELEAVEIDHAGGDQALRPASAADRGAQPVEEERAVGQRGQPVVQRLMAERFLGLALLGHVVKGQHGATELAIVADDLLAPRATVAELAVGADDGVLQAAHDLATQEPRERGVVTAELRDGVALDADAAPEPFVRALPLPRAPVIPLEDAVPEHDRTCGIGGHDARLGVVDDCAQEGELAVAVGGVTGVHPAAYRHVAAVT